MRSRGDPVAGRRPGRPAPERRLWEVVKVLKVLKMLNFSGAGKSNIFASTGDDPHRLAPNDPQPNPRAAHRARGIGGAQMTISADCQLGGGPGSVEDRTMRSACRPSREKARRVGDRRSPARAVVSPVAV